MNRLAITEAEERSTTSIGSFAQYLLGARSQEIQLGSSGISQIDATGGKTFCSPNLALSDGRNLLHLCFPMAKHSEASWGMRSHLLMRFLNGAVARA
jgi:hypothetical protein